MSKNVIAFNISSVERDNGINYEVPIMKWVRKNCSKEQKKLLYFLNPGHDYDKKYIEEKGGFKHTGKGYESEIEKISEDLEEQSIKKLALELGVKMNYLEHSIGYLGRVFEVNPKKYPEKYPAVLRDINRYVLRKFKKGTLSEDSKEKVEKSKLKSSQSDQKR